MRDYEKRQFFSDIAIKLGTVDVAEGEKAYMAVVKTIVKNLRVSEKCEAPDFGKFNLKRHKARKSNDARTGNIIYIPEMSTLKFTPDYKLKKYFRSL